MTRPTHINTRSKRTDAGGIPSRPLPLTIRHDQAELDALWSMTPQQRVDAMWASQLTMSQPSEWTFKRPREVALLGHEYAWLAMHTPEFAEAHETVNNLVELPKRGDRRAAA